ncbi:MAG: hypothetical protein M1839_002167 [Geoglossum umbratile]|nr:MAG: hypothetical protein M1839_002167 [Geoglossum umbratile]
MSGLEPPSPPPWAVPRLERKLHRLKLQFILSLVFLTVALALIIALSVPHGILWKLWRRPLDGSLVVTTVPSSDFPPITNSGLGAANLVLGNYFFPSQEPETKAVYDAGGGKLCIRAKSGPTWRQTVQCVASTNAKGGTPLTMLDWIGGPSIFYLTNDNLLSGIDHVPKNDTWRVSSIAKYKVKAHALSQLGSVACLNGTSAWVHYQGPDGQIYQFGMDDYRDQSWRGGSTGPLALAQVGAGIGITRWLNGTNEVEELFFQSPNGAIHARMYVNSAWLPDIYTIQGTPQNVPDGASISVATVNLGASNSVLLLSYVAKSGFLNIQTRGTANTSDYLAFNSPIQLPQESGKSRVGLAVVSSSRIRMVVGQKIVELSSNDPASSNWVAADI